MLCGGKWLPIGTPKPDSAEISSSRLMAWAMAWRTLRLSNGFLALLVARITSPSVVPTTTVKRGSLRRRSTSSGAWKPGKASTSPASRAFTCAEGSLMILKITVSSLIEPGSR